MQVSKVISLLTMYHLEELFVGVSDCIKYTVNQISLLSNLFLAKSERINIVDVIIMKIWDSLKMTI